MKIRSETTLAGSTSGPTLLPPGSRISEQTTSRFQTAGEKGHSRPSLYEPQIREETESVRGETQISYDEQAAQNPFGDRPQARGDVRGTSDDIFGAFSIETFASASSLTYTHEDAQGWYDYLSRFSTPNFWYRDEGVKPWAYYEDYDNWQDTYGFDAVLAVYHSGHGWMDNSNGVFWAPVGGDWGGLGTWVHSDLMRLGNEQANYIFWSTCVSCRVLDGQNPIRTWQPANLGFRMLFGFETTSVDNPNYGKFFWEEWNKNKSFSQAWLDASWRISSHQAPSVVACGASAAEAQDRLYNERFLQWPHASNAWYWWRWYYAASAARSAVAPRRPNLTTPRQNAIARLRPADLNARQLRALVERLGLDISMPRSVAASRDGAFVLRDGDISLAASPDGSFHAQLRQPNRENRNALSGNRAVQLATDYLRQLELDADAEVVFDRVRLAVEAGGTGRGDGRVEGPFTTETTVQFKQLIDGVPVVVPGQGELIVTVDNDSQITAVQSSLRGVDRLIERAGSYAGPSDPKAAAQPPFASDNRDYEQRLNAAWGRQLSSMAGRGPLPGGYRIIPDTTEIGYRIEGNQAELVVQRLIEVDCGQGLLKQYWIVTPLSE